LSLASHARLMASYNQWMNEKLYAAAATLPEAVLAADRKAFFGSILGTFKHLVNADIIWLKRLAAHPAGFAGLEPVVALPQPTDLFKPQASSLAALVPLRRSLDAMIVGLAAQLEDAHFDVPLSWTNSRGETWTRNTGGVLDHFFNHQTHHRGQVTTLLSQEGVDFGDTDLLLLLPAEEAA
jgi:uncharacterized damage-inducible protein DinB